MTDVFDYSLQDVPGPQHKAFLDRVKEAIIPRVKEALFAGASPGLLDVEAEIVDGVIRLRVVDLSAEEQGQSAFLNEKSPDEFYNTVTEDEFMARVMTAVREVTPHLYEMFAEAERIYR